MKLPVLSHTLITTFERCPKQAFHRYVAKDTPFEESEASRWGNRVHEALEKRIQGEPLPGELGYLEKWVKALPDDTRAEVQLGMTSEGKATGFFSPDVWLRGKVDALVMIHENDTAFIADWKTGKPREDAEELRVHALLVRANYPHIQRVQAAYVWLKEDRVGKTHDVSDVAPVFNRAQKTAERLERAMQRDQWPANETPLCGWCSVKSCKYWRSR